jgi:hypothetical protein
VEVRTLDLGLEGPALVGLLLGFVKYLVVDQAPTSYITELENSSRVECSQTQ